jgi:integrase
MCAYYRSVAMAVNCCRSDLLRATLRFCMPDNECYRARAFLVRCVWAGGTPGESTEMTDELRVIETTAAGPATGVDELLGLAPGALIERLRAIAPEDFQGAYSDNTRHAWRASWRVWRAFCHATGTPVLPATVESLRAFLTHRIAQGRKRSTLDMNVATLAMVHRLAELPWPLATQAGKLMWRSVRRSGQVRARRRQKDPLGRDLADEIVAALTAGTGDELRDAAMLYVACETLCRRSNLVAFTVEQLVVNRDGTSALFVEKSKTDPEGEGKWKGLSVEATAHLQRWLEHAEITSGALFRSIPLIPKPRRDRAPLPGRYPWPLTAGDVARIFKRRASALGIDVSNISGHSARIGAAQDLAAAGATTIGIQLAGDWKRPDQVFLYTELLDANRGAMAEYLTKRAEAKARSDGSA